MAQSRPVSAISPTSTLPPQRLRSLVLRRTRVTPAEWQKGQIGGIYYRDDLIAEPMRLVEGAVEVPIAPGMGINVDLKKIEKYRVAL